MQELLGVDKKGVVESLGQMVEGETAALPVGAENVGQVVEGGAPWTTMAMNKQIHMEEAHVEMGYCSLCSCVLEKKGTHPVDQHTLGVFGLLGIHCCLKMVIQDMGL